MIAKYVCPEGSQYLLVCIFEKLVFVDIEYSV